MKWLSFMFIVAGLCFIGFAGWKIINTKVETNQAKEEAKKIVTEASSTTIEHSKDNPYRPENGKEAGLLLIPKLEAELPIIEGTDPDALDKGVGHYEGSYYPNEEGQIVLSGHRDTVFRRMGELEIGDLLVIQLPYGEFTYEMIDTKIVAADDTSIITLQNEKEELVLTTCYPFSFIGNAPDRYIIYAKRV